MLQFFQEELAIEGICRDRNTLQYQVNGSGNSSKVVIIFVALQRKHQDCGVIYILMLYCVLQISVPVILIIPCFCGL